MKRELLYISGLILIVMLSYLDRVRWHSGWSYGHYGTLTGCKVTASVTASGDLLIYKCKEAEVAIKVK